MFLTSEITLNPWPTGTKYNSTEIRRQQRSVTGSKQHKVLHEGPESKTSIGPIPLDLYFFVLSFNFRVWSTELVMICRAQNMAPIRFSELMAVLC